MFTERAQGGSAEFHARGTRPERRPKVAIVHYWWLTNRGGEAVCKALFDLYPHADLFLHVCDENLVRETLGPSFTGKITQTFISRLPKAKTNYQAYLPLMPLALEQLDLTAYDLVISSESGPAKGVITRPDAVHICYCHSPMRYVWDMYHTYLRGTRGLKRLAFALTAHWLRVWDRSSATHVDHFVANSSFVASRIAKFYRREATVVFPPVDVERFRADRPREDFYVYLGQLLPYKGVQMAVDAFNANGLPLYVVGEGELKAQLTGTANSNVKIMGRQSQEVVRDLLERCRALIFPGVEDFGIVPVEAMAAGAPVIALGRGGACESVVNRKTGIFFFEQTVEALASAVSEFELLRDSFDSSEIREHAKTFARSVFVSKMKSVIDGAMSSPKLLQHSI